MKLSNKIQLLSKTKITNLTLFILALFSLSKDVYLLSMDNINKLSMDQTVEQLCNELDSPNQNDLNSSLLSALIKFNNQSSNQSNNKNFFNKTLKFLKAIKNNDLETFEKYIEDKEFNLDESINKDEAKKSQDFKYFDGFTPLAYATIIGNNKFVSTLLENGADYQKRIVNNQYNHTTPISMSIDNGDIELIKIYINYLNPKNSEDQETLRFMLFQAIKQNKFEAFKYLAEFITSKKLKLHKAIKSGKQSGKTPIFFACEYGNTKIAEYLIKDLINKKKR